MPCSATSTASCGAARWRPVSGRIYLVALVCLEMAATFSSGRLPRSAKRHQKVCEIRPRAKADESVSRSMPDGSVVPRSRSRSLLQLWASTATLRLQPQAPRRAGAGRSRRPKGACRHPGSSGAPYRANWGASRSGASFDGGHWPEEQVAHALEDAGVEESVVPAVLSEVGRCCQLTLPGVLRDTALVTQVGSRDESYFCCRGCVAA